ncbi:YD repeat-containing protein [Pontibacter ummariensis]|uniref:YD repeat-containing protein n=1 Tax=Pontibacter ummariensis TaxID=1610492 RepID=A0A239IK78_9BACT|nr:hypothetical protein [Pontibacter ummariensis]PRY09843.1 YD repeat-containing protein [Pontibacter ummariensis]SNS92814.1 YD repeat-containing protein [Pontibacter ummariensis]
MKTTYLFPFALCLFLLSCGKEIEHKTCVLQSSVETITGGDQNEVSGQYSSTYIFDSDNKLTQIREEVVGEGASAGTLITTTYSYDSEGRIAEATTSSTNHSQPSTKTFLYNSLGQVIERRITIMTDGTETEVSRTEYEYAAPQELKSSRLFLSGELFETHEYTYTDGLMTGVRVTYGPTQNSEQLKPYQIEISYDNKRYPYAALPALLATRLDFGFPHQHNIVGMKANYDDGSVKSFHTYSVAFTYSPEGYPVSSNQSYPRNNYVERNYSYTYACE